MKVRMLALHYSRVKKYRLYRIDYGVKYESKLIDSLCDWVLEFRVKFKDLIESFLSFLDQNNLNDSEIAKKTLQVYKE
ncbi:MAG: hypothetical protein HWN81_04740 [Candidatus Lokiarchaeota archaeon]|nr:hypothetical protein [Candidatus Lokiarchaeota archaeon]